MIELFHKTSQLCSKITTENYSTSFAAAIKLLGKSIRADIYNVYGFVRFADEIVDTFHDYNKTQLLQQYKAETYAALENHISLNPILHSFQITVNKYNIDVVLIDAFFKSMEFDLQHQQYNTALYEEYIYGSAEVVGLICLYIFCRGDKEMYNQLKTYARSLGAAFQKVNFLRDIKADNMQLNRMYFPGCSFLNFTAQNKQQIEEDIQRDFEHAFEGIQLLPASARFGVYTAYKYYYSLFKKIKKLQPKTILEKRVRIPDYKKLMILATAKLRHQLNIL